VICIIASIKRTLHNLDNMATQIDSFASQAVGPRQGIKRSLP
jgi:hypothetical protein